MYNIYYIDMAFLQCAIFDVDLYNLLPKLISKLLYW